MYLIKRINFNKKLNYIKDSMKKDNKNYNRNKTNNNNEIYKEKINLEETKINLTTDLKSHEINKYILKLRNELKDYIKINHKFLKSFKPIPQPKTNSKIINKMISASEIANVGPMATIAGTIAELSRDYLIAKGSKHTIVDNGGDISFITNKKVICGIYAGKSSLSGKIAMEFKNKKLGVCSSSGTVGYSFSYGKADCVSVISKNTSIADGLATGIANKVKGKTAEIAINNGLNYSEEFKENYEGIIIILGDKIGTIGKIPKIINIQELDLTTFEDID